jgi:hypothetical protein
MKREEIAFMRIHQFIIFEYELKIDKKNFDLRNKPVFKIVKLKFTWNCFWCSLGPNDELFHRPAFCILKLLRIEAKQRNI